MTILRAQSSNLTEWVKLAALLFGEHSFAELYEEYEKFLTTEKEIGFLYEQEGSMVAFLNLSIRHDYVNGCQTSPVAYLEALYVLPAYRRRGIGRDLIAQAESFARAKGITQLASDCRLENTASALLHQRCGFQEKERIICFVKNIGTEAGSIY